MAGLMDLKNGKTMAKQLLLFESYIYKSFTLSSAPGRNRTCNPVIRSY
jgi:hypothetical protein